MSYFLGHFVWDFEEVDKCFVKFGWGFYEISSFDFFVYKILTNDKLRNEGGEGRGRGSEILKLGLCLFF